MRSRAVPFIFAGAMVALLSGPIPARAASMTFTASASSSDGPLAASAVITTSPGVLTVTLTNDLAVDVFRSPGQALSDISFTVSNAPGSGSGSASGQFGDIDKNGVVTYVSADAMTGFTSPIRWFLGTNAGVSGNTITLETIGGTGIGQPSEMIAPSIANGGTYTNANAGLKNFNSYVIGPATFTLNLPGIAADTTISDVTFSFGTGPDHFVPGLVAVPEPASSVLGITSLVSLGLAGLIGNRRRRATAV